MRKRKFKKSCCSPSSFSNSFNIFLRFEHRGMTTKNRNFGVFNFGRSYWSEFFSSKSRAKAHLGRDNWSSETQFCSLDLAIHFRCIDTKSVCNRETSKKAKYKILNVSYTESRGRRCLACLLEFCIPCLTAIRKI